MLSRPTCGNRLRRDSIKLTTVCLSVKSKQRPCRDRRGPSYKAKDQSTSSPAIPGHLKHRSGTMFPNTASCRSSAPEVTTRSLARAGSDVAIRNLKYFLRLYFRCIPSSPARHPGTTTPTCQELRPHARRCAILHVFVRAII